MKCNELLNFIQTEPNLKMVGNGFYYYGEFLTNEQLIELWKKRTK